MLKQLIGQINMTARKAQRERKREREREMAYSSWETG
jgi:hypothetical protein